MLGQIDQKLCEEAARSLAPQKSEPSDEATEVVASGGEDGVGFQTLAQMHLARANDVIHPLALGRSDQSFGKAMLPRRGLCVPKTLSGFFA